jgi:hypothetical protein
MNVHANVRGTIRAVIQDFQSADGGTNWKCKTGIAPVPVFTKDVDFFSLQRAVQKGLQISA